MTDDRDQIITSTNPEIEKDALAAAGFVIGMLGTIGLAAAWTVLWGYVGGAPGAFFGAATSVIGLTIVGTYLTRRIHQ